MKFTWDDVIQYVESEDVKFIRLAFCDKQGRQKNVAVMPGELPEVFENGFPLESSVLEGLPEGKLLLFPDPETLIQLPWRPQPICSATCACRTAPPLRRIPAGS